MPSHTSSFPSLVLLCGIHSAPLAAHPPPAHISCFATPRLIPLVSRRPAPQHAPRLLVHTSAPFCGFSPPRSFRHKSILIRSISSRSATHSQPTRACACSSPFVPFHIPTPFPRLLFATSPARNDILPRPYRIRGGIKRLQKFPRFRENSNSFQNRARPLSCQQKRSLTDKIEKT